jgi:signal transduction histidine kinase
MEERQRIARDMHDAVSQTLFTASMVADALPSHWKSSDEKGLEGIDKLKTLTKGALAELRSILLELRPETILGSDLGGLIEQLAIGSMSYLEVSPNLSIEGNHTLPDEVQIAIYRIAQEIFSNIVKHSRATSIKVDFVNRGNSIHLSITDNGVGFITEDKHQDRFGLKIIQERATLIGAHVEIESEVDKGTEICLDWPAPG